MLPSSRFLKNKEVLVSNDWGKFGKKNITLYGSRSILKMTLSLHHCDFLGWVIFLKVHHTYGPSYHHFNFGSMLPTHYSVIDMFKISHPVNPHPSKILSNLHFMTVIPKNCYIKSHFVFEITTPILQ